MLPKSQILAQLPRAISNERSKVFAAEVFSLLGTERKKRPELAIAVDGEGINIYDAGPIFCVGKIDSDPVNRFGRQNLSQAMRFRPSLRSLVYLVRFDKEKRQLKRRED